MSWLVPFGFGFLLGAAVFDFAWRTLWKLDEKLRELELSDREMQSND